MRSRLMPEGHPVLFVLLVAMGAGLYTLIHQLIQNVVFGALDAVLGTELRTLRIDLGRSNQPFDQPIFFGFLLSGVISLAIVGYLYLVAIRSFSGETQGVAKQECPYCLSLIPAEAVRCAYCAGDLSEVSVTN